MSGKRFFQVWQVLTHSAVSSLWTIGKSCSRTDHDDFWTVWNERFEMYRDRDWARQGICGDCKMFRYFRGNGMHLHDEEGKLLVCHYNRLTR